MIDVVWNIIIRDNRILMAQRSFSDSYGGTWVFPGGKVDHKDKTFIHAAKRELDEEVGVNCECFTKLCVLHFHPYKIEVFMCNCDDISPRPLCKDIIGVGWFYISEIYVMDKIVSPMTNRSLPYLAYILQHYEHHPEEWNN